MAAPFSATLRAHRHAARADRSVALVASAAALLGLWGAWFFGATVAIYETSTEGRLEVRQDGAAGESGGRPVDSALEGRIAERHLEIGRRVAFGDVLVELDARVPTERIAEENARLEAIGPELAARRRELAAEDAALSQGAARIERAIAQARTRREAALAQSELAAEEAARIERMTAAGATTEIEALRARAALRERRALADTAAIEIDRLAWQARTEDSEARARAARIEGAIAALEGEQEKARAAIEALRRELEKFTIRAPVAGVVGEVSAQRQGAFVQAGERLATVVPEGTVGAGAAFAPAAALGRIRAGQRARVRLAGFPWAQYGSLRATVSRVGTEVRDGKVRVELAVEPDAASRIPLQHGLPGEVEVEIERLAPYLIALRLLTDALTLDEAPGEG